MTLAELKSQIVNIENQLSSIDIPIMNGKHEVTVDLGLATDQSGKLYATFLRSDVSRRFEVGDPSTITGQIRNLGVGEQISFKFPGKRPYSVQSYTCKIGKQLGRVYKTRTNVLDKTVTVFRVE
jgi:hypothetical protein